MDLEADMNATPLAKLAPVVQTRADQARVDPPNYADLLSSMDVSQPHGAAPLGGGGHMGGGMGGGDAELASQLAAAQQQLAAQQHLAAQQLASWAPAQAAATPRPARLASGRKPARGGVVALLRRHRDLLIVAGVAFAVLQYGAPRLRGLPGLTTPAGGLNTLGLGLLSLVIGFATRVGDFL